VDGLAHLLVAAEPLAAEPAAGDGVPVAGLELGAGERVELGERAQVLGAVEVGVVGQRAGTNTLPGVPGLM
jgi:hypothetical protein